MQIFDFAGLKLVTPSYDRWYEVYNEKFGGIHRLPESPSSWEILVAAEVSARNNCEYLALALLEAFQYKSTEESNGKSEDKKSTN